MKRNIHLAIALLSISLRTFAQQDATPSVYTFNSMYFNPAIAGTTSELSASILNRNQWVGVEGAPSYQSANVQGKIANKNIGYALQINHQKVGPFSNTAFLESFSYQVKLNQETKLSFGLQGSLNSVRINSSLIKSEVANDVTTNSFTTSAMVPDAGAGVHLYSKNYFVGMSVLHLFKSKFDASSSGNVTSHYTRQFFMLAGYTYPVNEKVTLKPSMLVRYEKSAPVNYAVTLMTVYKTKYEAGLSFLNSKTKGIKGINSQINIITQYNFNPSLKLGYAYNIYLNPLGRKTFGSHEMVLTWEIKTKKSSKLIIDNGVEENDANTENTSNTPQN